MTMAFLLLLRGQDLMADIFKAGSDLANLGVLGILAVAVILLSLLMYRAYQREVVRADVALAGWQAATTQFERALDLIEKMQSRRRGGDAS